jgi:hypothetical protein
MPNTIKPKRSYTANSVPLTTDLETHELAINWQDGKAFTKNASGNIVSVTLGGGGGGGAASVSYDYATTADLPATGNAALLYCTTDTGRLYRWTGSVYAEVGPVI